MLARFPEMILKYKSQVRGALAVCVLGMCFIGCWKKQAHRPVILQQQTEKPDDFRIRVLLFDNIKECRLSSTAGFSVKNASMELIAHFNSESGVLPISLESSIVRIGEDQFAEDIIIVPDNFSVLEINSKKFRGDFHIIVSDTGKSFRVINKLGIEEYLAGVVGAEMPSYWESEALKAQAMAARTYCLFIKNKFGVRRQWDVKRTQANQVYRGISAETARVRRAVMQTKGLVLVCRHRDGETKIFPSYYSSTCGGHTENSYYVFGDYFGPLTGVNCGQCAKSARKEYLNWPAVEFDKEDVSARLINRYPNLASHGSVESIEEAKISSYGIPGRITSVKLTGSDGKTSYLRGEDLRLTVDPTGAKIKSTYCRIEQGSGKYKFYDGKGFGHGVGMCQHGAQTLARVGRNFKEILAYYYPGSKMKRLY